MNDAALVREHRLERHGLARRADALRDAGRDLLELVLAPAAITLDVDGYVHRPPDALRRDRGHDMLQRDEVLTSTPDEHPERVALHFDPPLPGDALDDY